MGIKHLNRYLRTHCAGALRSAHLSELADKTLAVDASIYLYRFEADGALMENMYSMLSLFHYYRIPAVFVFDGKAPEEKQKLVQQRHQNRAFAQQQYLQLKDQAGGTQPSSAEECRELNYWKKQMVQVDRRKVSRVKELVLAFGASYIDAEREADGVCARLVASGRAWACLSEDMDMFVYGCARVVRYFSILKHSAIVYHLDDILAALDMPHSDFRDICILSGTDYERRAASPPPDASASAPDASVPAPDASASAPDASASPPDASASAPDASASAPDASASPPDASASPPDASASAPDASASAPDATEPPLGELPLSLAPVYPYASAYSAQHSQESAAITQWFERYKHFRTAAARGETAESFTEWLCDTAKDAVQMDSLRHIRAMFDQPAEEFAVVASEFGTPESSKRRVREVMEEEGFMFA
jgi:hypothetical protein